MKHILILLVTFLLAACDGVPRDNSSLKPPAKFAMLKMCQLPSYPDNDGDPLVRATYDVKVRTCAAKRGRQVAALQAYARRVSKPATD